ncbi:MAG: SOS response-associated peptidase [Phycisphaerae bacterium]
MCGRFTLTADGDILASVFELAEIPAIRPRYNIAPTQPVLVIVPDRESASETQPPGRRLASPAAVAPDSTPGRVSRVARMMLWGLIPSWAKNARVSARMINARAETVATSAAYRAAFKRRRCLIPADGFYEWQRVPGANRKQPFLVSMSDSKTFAFAGLWERWEGSEAPSVESCTVITTEPNDVVREVHDRMPAILDPSDYQRWLDPDNTDQVVLLHMLCPYPASKMTAQPVGLSVNNPSYDGEKCVEPLRGKLPGT